MNFYNQIIDKKGLKRIVSWFVENYGPVRTAQLIEDFQFLGFHYATRAGLSLGFDDLRIPPTKATLLEAAQKQVRFCENNYARGHITALERYQKLIDIWTTTSENLKEEVIQNFQKTPLNPLYMMAFSGARGNISQVRQLVGMRGLMSDSGGGIIDFPIRSNFREGLSVTEYVISCYGARKGLIDTALRTADSGYLTRRLVDVAHAIMITEIDCGTAESISVAPLEKNLLGRVLAENIRGVRFVHGESKNKGGGATAPSSTQIIALANQDISAVLAREILQGIRSNRNTGLRSTKVSGRVGLTHAALRENGDSGQMIRVRSPLSCEAASANLCQMCYGWNLAQGRFVSIGDAVGILAAQSIGEPGTQLTMRTFHTGGIFSTDVEDKIFAPHDGFISYQKLPQGCKLRSVHGETGFFSLEPIQIRISPLLRPSGADAKQQGSILQLPASSLIFVYPGKFVQKNDLCAEISRLTPSTPATDAQVATHPKQPLDGCEREGVAGGLNLEPTNESLSDLQIQKKVLLKMDRSEVPSAETRATSRLKKDDLQMRSKSEAHTTSSEGSLKTSDESSSEIQGAAYKLVFSEIQGQVSLGYGRSKRVGVENGKQNRNSEANSFDSSVFPNEVWVLAGECLTQRLTESQEKYRKTSVVSSLPGDSNYVASAAQKNISRASAEQYLNCKSKFRFSSTRQSTQSHQQKNLTQVGTWGQKPLAAISGSRFVGYVGDLLYFKGYRVGVTKLNPSRNFFTSGGTQVPLGWSEAPPVVATFASAALEVRDSSGPKTVLRLSEQKRPIAVGSCPPQIINSYVLGALIRSHDEVLKTEYSAQIIRKISARSTRKGSHKAGVSLLKHGNPKLLHYSSTRSNDLENKNSIVLRRVQPHLVSGLESPLRGANLRPLGSMVQEKDVLFQLLLPLQQSKTGDIVQGLPKIEQLFEGRGGISAQSTERENSSNMISPREEVGSRREATIGQAKLNASYHTPALRALQQRLVDEIQSVYQSQGVEIADKHVEIIVRLMTSKVKILEKGRTSFFPDDIVDLHHVRAANLPESYYEPIVLGITKVAFLTESFVSAASFQETKRVLMNSAIQNRVDFLHGLKENVIVGRLIPAGTGFVQRKY